MRADPNLYTSVNAAIQQSERQLQNAMNQLSSGKRVALPSDDPLAFAQSTTLIAQSAQVDRYTANANTVLSLAQQADSALSSVVTALTQAITLGTEGGNSTVSSSQRASLVQQVQGLLSGVISQANLTSNGHALFAGTAGTSTPFVSDPSSPNGYLYQGNSASNRTDVGQALQVDVNVPGNTVFTNSSGSVLGSLQQVITALQSGVPSDLSSATSAVTAAITQLGQVRAIYGTTINQLNAQNNVLSQDTVSLTAQQNALTGVDFAKAATDLTQAQTTNSAVLAMAAKILPQSLLTYLH